MKRAIDTSAWRQWQPGEPLLRLAADEVRERFELWEQAVLAKRHRLSYSEYIDEIIDWKRFNIEFPSTLGGRKAVLERAGCPWQYEPAIAAGFAWGDQAQPISTGDIIGSQPMTGSTLPAWSFGATSLHLNPAGIAHITASDSVKNLTQAIAGAQAAEQGPKIPRDLLDVDDYAKFVLSADRNTTVANKRRLISACDRAEDACLSLGWFRGIDFSGESGELFVELARGLKDELTWQEYLFNVGYARKYFRHEGLAKGRISKEQFRLIMQELRHNLLYSLANSLYDRKSRPNRQNPVLPRGAQAEFVEEFAGFMAGMQSQNQNYFNPLHNPSGVLNANKAGRKINPALVAQATPTIDKTKNKAIPHLSFIDLSYSDLSTMNLVGADINFCVMQFANLEKANLDGVDLAGTDIRGAKISQNIAGAYGLEYVMTSGEQIPFLILVNHLYDFHIRGSVNSWVNHMSFVPESDASMRQNSRRALKLLSKRYKERDKTNNQIKKPVLKTGPVFPSTEVGQQQLSTYFYWKSDFSFLAAS